MSDSTDIHVGGLCKTSCDIGIIIIDESLLSFF